MAKHDLIKIIGRKYGRLTIVREAENIGKNRAVECVCECGNTHMTRIVSLTRKYRPVKSCGCLKIEANRKHGMAGSSTYAVWNSMLGRCYRKSQESYKLYGGLGVGVCKRWKKFDNFLNDMGVKPPGKSLDRLNNSKGYCLENCRWSSPKEQARNRKTSHFLKYKGKNATISEWSEITGIKRATIHYRIAYLKWPVERALEYWEG